VQGKQYSRKAKQDFRGFDSSNVKTERKRKNMPNTKSDCVQVSADQIANTGLSGKTPTKVVFVRHGSTVAVEFTYSGGTTWIKVRDNGRAESGGGIEWGTGTEVVF
jgi:hypothetical protein